MNAKSVHFPAEWETQSSILLTWPKLEDNAWCLHQQDDVHRCFTEIANTILLYQDLIVVCSDKNHQKFIQKRLHSTTYKITYATIESNDVWARDHGPISVRINQQTTWLDFCFNGWGNKFDATLDNLIPKKLGQQLEPKRACVSYKMVLEGGALESDGQGSILSTKSCLLDTERNPDINIETLKSFLKNSLGCQRLLMLNHGHLIGDDTDGHIDTLARFVNPETIIYQSCDDKTDSHYESLTLMREELASFTTANQKPYQLIPLPLPKAKFNQDGERLPASYANFLIINNAVLFPRYNDAYDDEVRDILHLAFPHRRIHGIDCEILIEQYGSLHCVTMQLI